MLEIEHTHTHNQSSSMKIPIDLMLEILSRSSAKSIVKFRSTSKFWSSILQGQYFTELFLTRSSSRPRLLLAMERAGEWRFFSIPQFQDPYKKPSLIVAADYHMKFPGQMCQKNMRGPVYGLVYFPDMRFLDKDNKSFFYVPVILNPSTGQYLCLPIRKEKRNSKKFLGFDPVHKQFKLLAVPYLSLELYEHYIITLGTENASWRMIQCPFTHYPQYECEGICINGVLYYLSYRGVVCFDVSLEKFKFIEIENFCYKPNNTKLVNFKGKLGVGSTDGIVLKLFVSVLEDADKHEWSENVYTLQDNKFYDWVCNNVSILSILGVTAAGEIVMSMKLLCPRKKFCVMYFSPERYTLQSVEIQSFGANREAFEDFTRVYAFSDYVEGFNFL